MGSVSTQNKVGATASRREHMSAFVDSESFDEIGELGAFITGMSNPDRLAWSDYHLIGDALRSDDLAESPARSSAFMASFSARFESEAHVLAPAAVQ